MYLGAELLRDANGRPFVVAEGNTCVITARLLDERGEKIPRSFVSALTLKLFAPDVTGQPFLGGTDAGRDILDNNGGSVVETATETTLTVTLSGADNAIADVSKAADASYVEWHIALFEGTYAGKPLKCDQKFLVRNLLKVSS